MREIKFEYIYKLSLPDMEDDFIKKVYTLKEIEESYPEDLDIEHYAIIAKRQYTGLKDKNGVDIYEGDILLKQGIGKFKEINEKSIIKILNGNTYSYYDPSDKELISNIIYSIEVIGNIYENQELLKGNI